MSELRLIDKFFRNIFWDKIVKSGDERRMSKQSLPIGIAAVKDIPYIEDGNPYHTLDIYYPEGRTSPKLPVIIDMHGGGLMYGNKELNRNYCYNLAKRGFIVFNLNYRLAPEDRYPASVQDCSKALTWIGENIKSYDFCDAENIFVTGDSAGGFLAAITAAINSSDKMQHAYNVSGHKLKVRALGLTSGMFELDKSMAKLQCPAIFGSGSYKNSPYKPYVNFNSIMEMATLPPCFLVTSAEDMIHGSTIFFDKLLEGKGIEHKLMDWGKVEGHKLEHVFSILYPIEYPESVATIDGMIDFFKKHMA